MNRPILPFLLFALLPFCLFAQAPTGLNGTGYRTTVHLQWDGYTGFEPLGFNIYRSTTSGSYGVPVRRVGAYTDYTDYKLTANTTYFYKITAFDGAGNESPFSNEISVSTNDNIYRKVANLDLLVPIYTGDMPATAPDEIRQSLEFARDFFFRNSAGQVNLKFHYWIIDGFPPLRPDGVADFNTIATNLTNRGILNDQYDAIHIMSLKLYGWFGGATWLGQTAGSMGFDWRSFDPNNHYGQGNAWLFTHEFGHSLDRLADMSGFPEMIFNHYPWAHPIPAELGGIFDAGENFDGMSLVLRLFKHHLDFQTPHDGYLEVVDKDNDGLADNDDRLVNDEQRFSSNPNLADTDNDGLNDLDEFMANNYHGSNPNNPDSDGDGISDGMDIYPTSNFDRTNEKIIGNITINGMMSANEDWHEMGNDTYFSKLPGATLKAHTTWDEGYLYFAFQSNKQLKYYLKIDGSGEDGIFASDAKWPSGNYDDINDQAFGNAWYDEATIIIHTNETKAFIRNAPVASSQTATVLDLNGLYTTEVKLPHNLGPGFAFSFVPPNAPTISEQVFGLGDIIGIQLAAQPESTSVGHEWDDYRDNQWLSLNEPFHYYDMELVEGGSPGKYCTTVSAFPWEDWIAKVSVGTISNTSGKSTYSDFTALSTDLTAGTTANISLTTKFSYFTFNEYWKVWIDFNQNGKFEEPGEIAFQGIKNAPPNGTPTAVLNGNLSVPLNALTGETRMRITMKRGAYATPCETIPFGEIEDYSVNIQPGSGNLPDLVIGSSLPPNGTPGSTVMTFFDIHNGGTETAPSGHKVIAYLSTDNLFSPEDIVLGERTINEPLAPGTTIPEIQLDITIPAGQAAGNYYVIHFADAGNVIAESNEANNFYVRPFEVISLGQSYCPAKSNFPWEDWIAGVQLSNLSNASGKSPYSDFTAKTANIQPGQSYPVNLTAGFSYFTFNEYWRIWIDFNLDGDFTDAGEMVFSQILNAPPNGTPKATLNGTVSIPSSVQPGATTRMRVSMKRGSFPTPCETLPFGEVEDYTILIGMGSPCGISFATGNKKCQNAGTPNDPSDDTFTFEVFVLGTTNSNWLMDYPGGTTGGFTSIPTEVGPFLISNFPNGLDFTITEVGNPTCHISGTEQPPATCSSPTGSYCKPKSNFPWEDWIAGVQINTLNKPSGKSPYSDFTTLSTDLQKGVNYKIDLTAGFSYFTYDEYWSVWVDLNHDYNFTPDELLVSKILMRPTNGTPTKKITGNINIPAAAATGPTRMRVIMKRGAFAGACENIPFGEIEDYTVNIIDNYGGSNMEDRAADISFKAIPERTWINLYSVFNFSEKLDKIHVEKSADNISFDLMETISGNGSLNYPYLLETEDRHPFYGDNYYRLLFVFENGEELYSDEIKIEFRPLDDLAIFPNPASSGFFVHLNNPPNTEINWVINDAYGRIVWTKRTDPSMAYPYRIETDDLKPGMYYLTAKREGMKDRTKRFIVAR